jgi:hypothetical protein
LLLEEVGVSEVDGDVLGLGFEVGLGATLLIGTPLDQINFLPDFEQVNTYPLFVTLVPAFLHAVPGFGEAALAFAESKSGIDIASRARPIFTSFAGSDFMERL